MNSTVLSTVRFPSYKHFWQNYPLVKTICTIFFPYKCNIINTLYSKLYTNFLHCELFAQEIFHCAWLLERRYFATCWDLLRWLHWSPTRLVPGRNKTIASPFSTKTSCLKKLRHYNIVNKIPFMKYVLYSPFYIFTSLKKVLFTPQKHDYFFPSSNRFWRKLALTT